MTNPTTNPEQQALELARKCRAIIEGLLIEHYFEMDEPERLFIEQTILKEIGLVELVKNQKHFNSILDEKDQLRAELASTKAELEKWKEGCLGNADAFKDACRVSDNRRLENISIKAELAEAKKDKARLDWLECNHTAFAEELMRIGWKSPNDAQWEHLKFLLRRIRHATDSAIDNAMKESK